jgi:hypothetical protein
MYETDGAARAAEPLASAIAGNPPATAAPRPPITVRRVSSGVLMSSGSLKKTHAPEARPATILG